MENDKVVDRMQRLIAEEKKATQQKARKEKILQIAIGIYPTLRIPSEFEFSRYDYTLAKASEFYNAWEKMK